MATNKDSAALKTHKRPRGERAVNDDEVEEFFTILKRLQGLKNGAVRSSTVRWPCRMTWRPEFTVDDFKEVPAGRESRSDDVTQGEVKMEQREREEVVASRSFDLNAEPSES